MAGVLEGLRVVAMEHMEAAPAATLWMADWGAEVIKIEPLTGDMFRGTAKAHGISLSKDFGNGEIKWSFQLLNRNKRSVALNLTKPKGLAALYELVKTADVFISNYELSALKKLKADFDSLKKVNPKIVYGFVSGYGTEGPDKDLRGFDHAAGWARSGMQYSIGDPGVPPPRLPGGTIDRGVAGPHLLAGILGAIIHRDRTGEGQLVEVSLFQSGVWAIALTVNSALVGSPMPKDDISKAQNPLYSIYQTKGGGWIQMSMIQPDLYWHNFCLALEKPELENDERFNSLDARIRNCEELIRIINKVLATKTIHEWDVILRKYDLIYSRVQSPTELINDPQALANNFFVDLQHPLGTFKVVATPVTFRQNPASVREPAPELGQNTEEMLLELGHSWEDIGEMKDSGAIL